MTITKWWWYSGSERNDGGDWNSWMTTWGGHGGSGGDGEIKSPFAFEVAFVFLLNALNKPFG